MLNDSLIVLKNYLKINRNLLLAPILVVLLSRIAFALFHIKPAYIVLIISFSLVVSVIAGIKAKILSINSLDFGFSYKYFWNLPMHKRSLLIGIALIGVARVVPTLAVAWLYYDHIQDFFLNGKAYWKEMLLFTVDVILISILGSVSSYTSSFSLRRKSHTAEKYSIVHFLTYSSLFISMAFIFIFVDKNSRFFFETYFHLKDFDLGDLIEKLILSPYNILLFTLLILMVFHASLKYQRNEVHNYYVPFKQNRKIKITALFSVPFNVLILFYSDFGFGPDKQFVGHPVFQAIESKNISLVKKELEKISDINFENKFNITPMYAALFTGKLEIVKLIREKGGNFTASYRAQDYLNQKMIPVSAYDIATGSLDFDTIKYVADETNRTINDFSYFQGGAPLHLAAKKCDLTLVRKLVASGADVNLQTVDKKETPLILASKAKCATVVLMLLSKGADRNIANRDGKKAIELVNKESYSGKEIEGILLEN